MLVDAFAERLPGLKKNTSLPQLTKTDNIHVPAMQLTHRPLNPQTKNQTEEYEEELEDWTAETSELFEWVGLACLGSQRLDYSLSVEILIQRLTDAHGAACRLTTVLTHISRYMSRRPRHTPAM